MSDVQRFNEEVQRAGKDGFDAAVSSFGEANKGFQAIAAEIASYSKKSFEDGTRTFEQLIGAKSLEQAFEIQSQYAKRAFARVTMSKYHDQVSQSFLQEGAHC